MVVYLKKDKFEELLFRKNLSYENFAEILGVSRQYIYMLREPEKYDLSPSPELREKMLNFFGAMFDDIFFIQNGRFSEQNNKNSTDAQPNQENPNSPLKTL